MSVPAQTPISGPYIANGVTTQFAYQFYLLEASDLLVYVGGSPRYLNIDYTVTGVGNSQGGNVVFNTAPGASLEVLIKRSTPYTRQTDYADNGDLLADVLNTDMDRLWLALQEIFANFSSSISRPVGGNWDALGLRITGVADGVQPQDVATIKQLTTLNGSAGQSAQAAAASAVAAALSELNARDSELAAKTSETNAKDSEQKAKTSETNAKTSEDNAKSSEINAGNSKDSAALSAQSAAQSKADVGDVAAAVAAIKGVATLPLGLPYWWFSRNNLAAGSAPYDGQEVSQTTYPSMYAEVQAGRVPVASEVDWWANPSKRNCFTLGSSPGMFRLPDYNGAQVGSIAQMTLAGGTASQTGSFHGEAPNARGKIGANGTGIFANNQNTSGVFTAPQSYPNGAQAGGAVSNAASQVEMNLSLASSVYKDSATDILAARVVGVWCGQLFGRVTNPGAVDGATLATRMEAINTDLLSKIDKAFIRGLDIAIFGNITIGPGAFKLPNGTLISLPNTLTSALPTTVANTWYHFYLYSNSGTPALEVSTVDPVAYAYPAHQKTNDPSRRYIGSARTNASNAFYKQTLQNGQCIYQGDWASQRILAGGVATAFTAMSIGFGTPVTAYEIRLSGIVLGTNGSPAVYSEADNQAANCTFPGGINNMKMVLDLPVQSYPNAYYKYVSAPGAGSGFYVDIGGYKYAR